MSSLAPYPKFRAFTAGNALLPVRPLVGGKLWTYAAGTTTPKATYTDETEETENTNPVILDARGEANVWLGLGSYKLVLTDALGIQQGGPVDNIKSLGQWFLEATNYADGLADSLREDLANETDATLGVSLLGLNLALPYQAGGLGAFVQDDDRNLLWDLPQAQRAQVKAYGSALDVTASIAAKQTLWPNRTLYAPIGAWSFSTLDLRGKYGGIEGDGTGDTTLLTGTTLKVRAATPAAFNAADATDVVVSPFTLAGFALDCNSLADVGVDIRYRHHYELRDLYILNALVKGVHSKDGFLGRSHNVRVTACPTGVHMEGSDHASQHYGMVITNCSDTHLLIEPLGTALDGNEALSFYGLTISDGAGIGVDDSATSSAFYGAYLGENLDGVVFANRTGTALIDGGVVYVGHTLATYGFEVSGGITKVRGTRINGQTNGALSMLTTGSGGKITFEACQFNLLTGGDQVLAGDPLGYGAAYMCFAPKQPRGYTCVATNCTATTVDGSGATNERAFTCTAVAAGTKSMSITAALVNRVEWIDGLAYLVVVYKSTIVWNVRLAGGPAGSPPTKAIGTLPANAGVQQTYVKLDSVLDTAAYTLLEFYSDSVVVGASLALNWVGLSDSRMPVGNLWKC